MNRVLLSLLLATVGLSSKSQVPTYNFTDLGNLQYLVGGLNGTNYCPDVSLDYMLRPIPLYMGSEQAGSLSYGQHLSSLGGSVGGQFTYFQSGPYDFTTLDLIYNYDLKFSRQWSIRLGVGGGIANESSLQLGKNANNLRGEASLLAFSSDAMLGLSYQRSSVVAMNFVGGKRFGFDRFGLYPILFGRYETLSSDSGFRRWLMGLVVPVSLDKWKFGLSATRVLRNSVRLGALVGRKITPSLSILYSYGSAGRIEIEKASIVDHQHQLSLRWKIPCKSKRRTFRTISCPAFGGGSYCLFGYSRQGSVSSSSTQKSEDDIAAGMLTASQLNDFSKWELWNDIANDQLKKFSGQWDMKPKSRYSVHVTLPDGRPVVDVVTRLVDTRGNTIWTTRTDNQGKAELWNGLFSRDVAVEHIEVVYDGQVETIREPMLFHEGINTKVLEENCAIPSDVDILFAVDATSSMGDEMEYVKTELKDIINRISESNDELSLRTGAMVYRCLDDDYITRREDFNSNVENTIGFLEDQSATGGGLEAVEVALDEAVNQYSWSQEARARLLFIVLDEAPGHDRKILDQLHRAIREAAEKGIRVIPLVASGMGYSTDKSLEYLMRSIALATNGTYAFLTDHSGIGNDHTEPTTDEYDVELLNDMLVRIINEYTNVPSCDAPYPPVESVQDTVEVNIIAHVIADSTLLATNRMADPEVLSEQTDNLFQDQALEEAQVELRSFKFYPNPANESITLEIKGDIQILYIADMSGKLIQKVEVNHRSRLQVDISNLSPGLYLLQYVQEGKVFSGKLVVRR